MPKLYKAYCEHFNPELKFEEQRVREEFPTKNTPFHIALTLEEAKLVSKQRIRASGYGCLDERLNVCVGVGALKILYAHFLSLRSGNEFQKSWHLAFVKEAVELASFKRLGLDFFDSKWEPQSAKKFMEDISSEYTNEVKGFDGFEFPLGLDVIEVLANYDSAVDGLPIHMVAVKVGIEDVETLIKHHGELEMVDNLSKEERQRHRDRIKRLTYFWQVFKLCLRYRRFGHCTGLGLQWQ